ncbi:MAG: hypothetical protein A3A83_01955 [Candidatus Doudnabacteria bacterium RIFCSPLOWO2_01_FULL_48_57]|nr:MAG: hypothetical protein A2668_04075 [Candidatus Doudnabacteria bacterium RIFCSPHIGHO2_01_FULL_48_180]OGE91287.1 MAG: hypothetical protein A3F44_04670 [Candidatus Doudnabacteria bacterium RIFCSPHIGHO2_12_FULL_47_25]OGE96318.1 MAG: hypothetical protein A3A83_01955 [Candidatus Doudnabacteria bacterium RIFCSPLOWO2_01_FULL_48_57]OGF01786.1 MAG: hypothetical protein A3G07_01670 [Candidatus Doudnabacteria bacterium RIFCSPLOWO2_12_FULL_47_12]
MKLKQKPNAFTLIELLVVISVIGFLASVIMVSLNSARVKARAARAAGDLRQLANVLSLYLADQGVYPCFDHVWGDLREFTWAQPYAKWPVSPWNTNYHWEHGTVGFTFSISVMVPLAEAQDLDKAIDDNNFSTGTIRAGGIADSVRLEYGGMDQSVPLIDCHI